MERKYSAALPLMLLFLMAMTWLLGAIWHGTAHAADEGQDAKSLPFVKQQREIAMDNAAQCFAMATDQQQRIKDLEKELADLKAKVPEASK